MQSPEVLSIGELLVEVMRTEVDSPLDRPGRFAGPFPSGAPAIFIDQVAKLGRRAGFVGSVGDDDFGRCCTDRLSADGVDVSQVKSVPGYTTGTAFVTYFSDGTRKFVFHLRHSAAGQISVADLGAIPLADASFLHICGSSLAMNENVRETCYQAARAVKASGGIVSFDPNLRPELLSAEEIREICVPVIESCGVILPSGEEASMVAGVDDPVQACERLLELGVDIVALKQGERGSTVFLADRRIEAPAFDVTPVDPTGAGDCYDAAFIVGMLEGWELEQVALFANAVGALGTTRLGPMEGAPTRREALDFVAGQGRPLGRSSG